MEVQAVVDVGGSGIVQGLKCMGEEPELVSFLDWESMQSSEIWGDVSLSWEMRDKSDCRVLDGVESMEEVSRDHCIESVMSW